MLSYPLKPVLSICRNLFRTLVLMLLFVNQLIYLQTLGLIEGCHMDGASSSLDQNIAHPLVNRSSAESERNIPTGSHHANRTQSIRDLDALSGKGMEKPMPQDQTEDVARKDTPTSTQTQSIEEPLELLRELREKNAHGNLHSSPQYGAGFEQPHTNPTPDASRCSDGTLHLLPEYKILSALAYDTNIYHYCHYHYNTPNVSPGPHHHQ